MPQGPEQPTLVSSAADDRRERFDFTVTVTQGPDTGKALRIDQAAQRVLVGTSAACVLKLTDAQVSRRHLALELTRDGLKLVDLGSTNGTRVDRVRVRECVLEGEELISLGGTMLRVEAVAASGAAPAATGFGQVVGQSEAMRRLYPLMKRLAQTEVPVVIEGETGTGKEALAEALHEAGPRAKGPFEVFDCTAVPPSLIESELFGHERGAFTGAAAQRKGVFELAQGGTLLIDEIGDLDLALQPKLLRALESREVRRVGVDKWLPADVRVIAATRRNLDLEVQAGRFRDDLFHRLAVARIELPPLRDREGDVELLARQFWRELGGDVRQLDDALLSRWGAASWPGNVRELRNAVARMLTLGEEARGQQARPKPGPEGPLDSALTMPFTKGRDWLLAEFERRYVERLLEQHGGDVAKAAAASGIGRRYFQKLRARTDRSREG